MIAAWRSASVYTNDLYQLAEKLGQLKWLTVKFDWHLSSHVLLALHGEALADFIRYVRQPIGPDMDCPVVQREGVV